MAKKKAIPRGNVTPAQKSRITKLKNKAIGATKRNTFGVLKNQGVKRNRQTGRLRKDPTGGRGG